MNTSQSEIQRVSILGLANPPQHNVALVHNDNPLSAKATQPLLPEVLSQLSHGASLYMKTHHHMASSSHSTTINAQYLQHQVPKEPTSAKVDCLPYPLVEDHRFSSSSIPDFVTRMLLQ